MISIHTKTEAAFRRLAKLVGAENKTLVDAYELIKRLPVTEQLEHDIFLVDQYFLYAGF